MSALDIVKQRLKRWLAEPGADRYELDDPNLTEFRKSLVKKKAFLRRVYQDWYREIARAIPPGPGQVLELGSGAGFLEDSLPGLIRSEIFWLSGNHLALDGSNLPFARGALKAIVMTDVLHHIPRVRCFFAEACRCLADGGVIAMIEPWNTPWSAWVYRRLHHEPFDPAAPAWEFPSSGPLSGANGALPWIIFERDAAVFAREFPQLVVCRKEAFMPFRYLLSGGVSIRSLAPGWSYPAWKAFEALLTPWMPRLGMFAVIVLRHTAIK